MPDTSFRILFDGTFQQGQKPEEVKARLAKLFKTSPEKIEQLCAGKTVTIKKGLNQKQAMQYKQAFEKAGALCRVERDGETPVAPPPIPNDIGSQAPKMPKRAVSPEKLPQNVKPSTEKKIQLCPKCNLKQNAARGDCMRCGIVFARFYVQSESEAAEKMPHGQMYNEDVSPEEEEAYTGPLSVEREGWLSLAGGAVITAIVVFFPFLNYILSYFIVLVHELGHSVSHWLFGYPSIPAFDFMYGGGVAIRQSRQVMLLVLIYFCFAYLLYLFRRNTLTLIILAVIVAGYSLTAFTLAHEVISLFMGHGFELLFATIFFYRAISGNAVIVAVERPLYGFLGLFIEFRDIRFAFRLITSSAYRADYEVAKGGGHWMDFSRIAEEYLRVDLTAVAGFFLVCCLIPPFAAFLAYRFRSYWMSALSNILNPEPE